MNFPFFFDELQFSFFLFSKLAWLVILTKSSDIIHDITCVLTLG